MNKSALATFTITSLGADDRDKIAFDDRATAEKYFKENFEAITEKLGGAPFIFAENYDFYNDPDGDKVIYPTVYRDGEKVYPL